jgi:hypothetical protein
MQIISVVVFLMVIISFPPVQPVGAFSLQGFLDRWDLDDEPDWMMSRMMSRMMCCHSHHLQTSWIGGTWMMSRTML